MIKKMISKIKKQLPLVIDHISWDGAILNMYGKKWNFSTLSAWRVISSQRVLFGCFDQEAENKIQLLKEKKILDIKTQSDLLSIDPIFYVSDGFVLEIFSTDTYEPWTFHTEETGTYVPTPADPEEFEKD